MSNSLQPCELQHARLPCASLSPSVCSDSCLLSHWCHPTISSSVSLFSSCPQAFPASGSCPVSWLFASGGPSTLLFHRCYVYLSLLIWRFRAEDFPNSSLLGAAWGITDKMEAWPQPPLLIPQARTQDEGVSSCDSDLFLPFFGWVGWKEC